MQKYKNSIINISTLLLFTLLIYSSSLMDGNSSCRLIYFLIAISILLLLVGILFLVNKNKIIIRLNKLDIVIILFLLWSLIRLLTTEDSAFYNEKILILALLVFFFSLIKKAFKNDSNKGAFFNPPKLLLTTFLLAGFIQAIIRILQLYGFNLYPSSIGSFVSPDYFAGYFALVSPFAFDIYIFSTNEELKFQYSKILGLWTFIAGIFTLSFTLNPIGYLAVFTGIAMLVILKYDIVIKISSYFKQNIYVIVV